MHWTASSKTQTQQDDNMSEVPATQQAPIPSKMAYINNLRSSLTALVIVHHAATSYGGEGLGLYQSSHHPLASSPALVGFNATNQSFFMGTFMFLGGYFSKKALERKSKQQFVNDRLYRLALPSIAYTLLGAPTSIAIHRIWRGETVGWQFLPEYWLSLDSLRGPVWFTGTLFCFDLCLAGFQQAQHFLGPSTPKKDEGETTISRESTGQRGVSGAPLLASLALCSASDVLLRTIYPCGFTGNPLRLQPAYVSQYVASYVFGVCVDDVRDAIPSSTSTLWALRVASGLSTYVLAHGLLTDPTRNIANMKGGWNTMAVSYAIWNNFLGFLLGSKLLQTFSQHSTVSWGRINDAAFPAFLVHMPILTLLGVTTDKWRAGPLLKTAVVGSSAVVLSWFTGYAGAGW